MVVPKFSVETDPLYATKRLFQVAELMSRVFNMIHDHPGGYYLIRAACSDATLHQIAEGMDVLKAWQETDLLDV